jgi:PilZ domain
MTTKKQEKATAIKKSGDKNSERVERRAAPREKASYSGQIISEDGTLQDCVITDLSPTGARLVVTDTSAVPDTFTLRVEFLGVAHRSRVAWRRETGLGITFES